MDIRQEIPIKSLAIAAYVCKIVDGVCKHLIIRRSSGHLGGTWQMVSGRIEHGEKGWEAALREIKEETRLVPDRFYSPNIVEAFYKSTKTASMSYRCLWDSSIRNRKSTSPTSTASIGGLRQTRRMVSWPSNNKRKCSRRSNLLFVQRTPNPMLEIKFK